MGDIDLVQFGSDTMLNLVHDVPQLNVSLPSVETYCALAQILQNNSQQRAFNPLEQLLGLNDLDNDIAPLQPHSKVFRAVKKYRLDVISERKLSQQFADKYPFLDLTNCESYDSHLCEILFNSFLMFLLFWTQSLILTCSCHASTNRELWKSNESNVIWGGCRSLKVQKSMPSIPVNI
jgi:hypothetical protein